MNPDDVAKAVAEAIGGSSHNYQATRIIIQAMEYAAAVERDRCMAEADKLRSNATCKKIRAACGALIDRIRKG